MVSPVMQARLQDICQKFDLVALISGRAVEDLRRLANVPGLVYVGNHGIERWERGQIWRLAEAESYVPVMNAVRHELEAGLGDGIVIEDKGSSLSVHYRRSPHPEMACRQIIDAVSRSRAAGRLRVTEGRMVIELRPPVPADKGTAVMALVEEYALRSVLYLGDDMTDVDAFRAIHRLNKECTGLAIAIVDSETTPAVAEAADLTLPGVEAAEGLFSWLACCL